MPDMTGGQVVPVAFVVVLVGCLPKVAPSPATPQTAASAPELSQTIGEPPADRAQVVFLRTSFVASAFSARIFEVLDGVPRFIGMLEKGEKLAYETEPGHKVFMACGKAADFMLGEVVGGRTYFVIVRPNWGSGAMIPTPIRADGTTEFNTSAPEFRDWLSSTRLVKTSAGAPSAYRSCQEIYAEYWAKFQTKTIDQKVERTLRPEDGMGREGP